MGRFHGSIGSIPRVQRHSYWKQGTEVMGVRRSTSEEFLHVFWLRFRPLVGAVDLGSPGSSLPTFDHAELCQGGPSFNPMPDSRGTQLDAL